MPETNAQRNGWQNYRVGKLSTNPKWTEPTCCPLTSIWHVTHTRYALDILRDRQITPRLVFDESSLNVHRILVNWMSPNDWTNAGGSRYGNIAFEFDWAKLIVGLTPYWVGAMTSYNPTAFRILLTDQDRSNLLEPYPSHIGDGPWWHDATNDKHYWQGNLCMEVLIEREIQIDEISSIAFVKHHANRCCISPSSCPDRGIDRGKGAALLLAGMIAHKVPSCNRLFVQDPSQSASSATAALQQAWAELWRHLSNLARGKYSPTGLQSTDPSAAAIAAAAIAAWANRVDTQAATLAAMFRSEKLLRLACEKIVADQFDVDPKTLVET